MRPIPEAYKGKLAGGRQEGCLHRWRDGVTSFPKVASSYGMIQAMTFSFCSALKECDFRVKSRS